MRSEPATGNLLDRISAEIETGANPLRFSHALEETYQASRLLARIRHYVRTSTMGLVSYNLFLFVDAVLVPDVLAFSMRLHIVITLICLCNDTLVFRKLFPPEMAILNLSLTFANTLLAVHISHSPDGIFYFFILPLFFVYGNIVLPLPFPFAAAFSAFCVMASGAFIAVQPGIHLGVRILLFLVQLCLAGYTLLATYRNEVFERRSYLLTLRETLRGEALTEQNQELSELSDTDGLTGIPNRRVFDRTLDQLWNEHLQSRTPLALLMIDIDHFKKLNDTYGHNNGDICLREAASHLRRLMRPHQSLARFGGEEFAVLLEGEGALQADAVAERLRAEIEAMPFILTGSGNNPHRITISIGCVTAMPGAGLSSSELFLAADRALYTAKREGRNRVCAQFLGFGHPSLLHSDAEPSAPPNLKFNVLVKN